jgi:hypothetical protein
MSEVSVGTVLAEALELLRTDGWTTYTLRNEHGQMCTRGALNQVCLSYYPVLSNGGRWRADVVRWAAEKVLEEHIPADFAGDRTERGRHRSRLCQYNNTRTTFTEIEHWFEKAIADQGAMINGLGS